MKLWKRAGLLLLALSLLLTVPASAAQPDAGRAAAALHSLGLFQGTAAGRFDEENMALEREATRAEALVMFVRLLGREGAALDGGYEHPFSDGSPWADACLGYAYQNGLVKGKGDGSFGAAESVTLDAYVTFILRALNYDEAAGDFSWSSAASKGVELGLYDAAFAEGCVDGMTRGALAQVSYAALSQAVKGSSETLAGSLVRLGMVDEGAVRSLGLPLEAAGPSPEPSPESGEDSAAEIQALVDLVNETRADAGLSPVALDEALSACAAIRAEEIIERFEHTRPDGRDCFSVLSDSGFTYRRVGENIAYGYPTAESVMDGWMNSAGHRANILESGYSRIGVGRSGTRWVQLFAD